MHRTHTHWFAGPLAVGAVLAVAVPATAAAPERPIHEELTGQLVAMEYAPDFPVSGDTFDGRCSQPSDWVSTSVGTGDISHLGEVSWTIQHCFQMNTGTFTDGRLMITADNGDELTGEYEGAMTGPTTFADMMTITGGTGRFTHASGQIDETGWFDPDTGYMEITGIGTITYDASDRASTR
jgi:hypothetical protein